jgi:hypothetical protein
MQNRFVRSLLGFFSGTSKILGTPSGDARGHVRVYVNDKLRSGRNF